MAIQVVQSILNDNWSQFSSNLTKFRRTGGSEFLHQARIGWRRFKSSLQFFKPLLPNSTPCPSAPLRPLLEWMGHVRDMDVALEVSLPAWRELYTQKLPMRMDQWQSLIQEIAFLRQQGRVAIALESRQPSIQSSLQGVCVWIEELPVHSRSDMAQLSGKALSDWMERRLKRLYRKLDQWQHIQQPKQQHKARLWAKRLRYQVEILQPFLSKRWVHQPLRKAKRLQIDIGMRRDKMRAYELVASLHHYPEVAQFISSRVVCQIKATKRCNNPIPPPGRPQRPPAMRGQAH